MPLPDAVSSSSDDAPSASEDPPHPSRSGTGDGSRRGTRPEADGGAPESSEHILETFRTTPLLLAYLSTPHCSVCTALLPAVRTLVAEYPALEFRYVDIGVHPLVAGQHLVFTVPTLLLLAGGREVTRFSRTVALNSLRLAIDRLIAHSHG